MLVGPDQVLIEVHRRLGKVSVLFDLNLALETTEEIELSGVRMQTLAKSIHFVYLCYHHARHFWSHLHWLADLDAMIRSSDFDRVQINKIADSLGIQPTIDAALDFHKLISDPELWDQAGLSETGGGQFLKACLVNLA